MRPQCLQVPIAVRIHRLEHNPRYRALRFWNAHLRLLISPSVSLRLRLLKLLQLLRLLRLLLLLLLLLLLRLL
jgi:hypothetical protein